MKFSEVMAHSTRIQRQGTGIEALGTTVNSFISTLFYAPRLWVPWLTPFTHPGICPLVPG